MDASAILKSWRTLNAFLKNCTLLEAENLLKVERSSAAPRRRFALRIYGRISVLRDEAGREAIMKEFK